MLKNPNLFFNSHIGTVREWGEIFGVAELIYELYLYRFSQKHETYVET
ncbi:MAG: hypothetical protein AAF349_10900 [Cyanobacteria bacterium P01_A01_bin.68]